MTGEYRLSLNPNEKDALLYVPNAGLTYLEQMGMRSKSDRIQNPWGADQVNPDPMYATKKMFDRLDTYARVFRAPSVKFRDLKTAVTTKLYASLLPFEVRTDFVRITDESVLTPVTVQISNRELQFTNKEGVMHAVLDVYGQFTTLTGKSVGTFEDAVALDVPENEFQRYSDRRSVYQKALSLRPGRYKLSIVVKDENSGRMGTVELGVQVPRFEEDKLSNSSLILADLIQPLPTTQVGTGPFVIGGTKVRPSVTGTFNRDQSLGIYMQVYNLGVDPESHRPTADIRYQILKEGQILLDHVEEAAKLPNASQQITLQKTMPLKLLQPGKYSVQITVTDKIKNQTVSPTTTFEVR